MNRNEMQSRLEELQVIPNHQKTLAEWHEAMDLCLDLGHDGAWSNLKRELEYWQRKLVAKKMQQDAGQHGQGEDIACRKAKG